MHQIIAHLRNNTSTLADNIKKVDIIHYSNSVVFFALQNHNIEYLWVEVNTRMN